MIKLIVGEKGKGKTKVLLDAVNEAAKEAKGNIVFIDKDKSHMYELKNTIRLVCITDYSVRSTDGFEGFISGLIAADHDLEKIFIDGFLKISSAANAETAVELLKKLDELSDRFDVEVIISVSLLKDELPDDLKQRVIEAL
ncbi:MAG: twitching motility protein PilT [Lachnospiraceae bacterium]|nr:twitching motility protein PilT [Lachnospiraceae bacterium]